MSMGQLGRDVAQWQITRLACARLWARSPAPKDNNNKNKTKTHVGHSRATYHQS